MTTGSDLPPVIYTYAATKLTDCEHGHHCVIQRGDTTYAYVSTDTLTRVTYCKHHWTEQAHN